MPIFKREIQFRQGFFALGIGAEILFAFRKKIGVDSPTAMCRGMMCWDDRWNALINRFGNSMMVGLSKIL